MIRELDGVRPQIHPTAYIHETAEVIGDVKIAAHASLWPGVVLRGDIEEIVVGEGSNIQDNTVIHTDHGIPTRLGQGISVGHSVVLHGCTVEDNALIGMGSVVLNGAVVEEGAMVAAGAVVSPGKRIPAGQLAMGVPAKAVRPLKPEEKEHNRQNALNYRTYREKHEKSSRVIARGDL